MLTELLIRFAVGGAIVSFFAVLGDLLKPKSFAGIFGAAPSVALATIFLTVAEKGRQYMAIEARSMILGALAFLFYSCVVMRVLRSGRWSVLRVTASALLVWIVVALGLWRAFLK